MAIYLLTDHGSPVFTKTPRAPGKAFLKASLFDKISPCGGEFFNEKRMEWLNVEQVQKA